MILALETATLACSAALCAADGSVVAERVSFDGPAHSQLLLPFVHEILDEAGAGWADVDTVAVGLGPGAFTGLRIGIATARALAQADGRAGLAGVPTLTALALGAGASAPGGGSRQDGSCRSSTAAAARCSRPSSRRTAGGVRQVEDVAVVPADDLAAWLAARGERGHGRRRRRALRRAAARVGAAGRAASSRRRPRWSAGRSPAARPASSAARTRCCPSTAAPRTPSRAQPAPGPGFAGGGGAS